MDSQAASRFILENARPLERAIYRWYFESGTKQAVVGELGKFQNPDGGFGHGLEADNWNPNSNPVATNDAIITLHRIEALGDADDIVNGIVRYLRSHDSFDEGQRRWLFAIETNKEYPHAIWWEKNGDGLMGYNPTVSLAAFMICFGGRTSYYEEILRDAFAYLSEKTDVGGDELKCYLLCYELLRENRITDLLDLAELRQLLGERLENAICKDSEKYGVEYVPTPSDFFTDPRPEFMSEGIRALIEAEQGILANIQKDDGGFDISWQWYTPYPEFEQARQWWRAKITIDGMLFARNA